MTCKLPATCHFFGLRGYSILREIGIINPVLLLDHPGEQIYNQFNQVSFIPQE